MIFNTRTSTGTNVATHINSYCKSLKCMGVTTEMLVFSIQNILHVVLLMWISNAFSKKHLIPYRRK